MATKLKALNNRVFVKRDEKETTSKGGIKLTENAAATPVRGKVVAVGPGKYLNTGQLIPPPVEVGDTVIFGTRAGEELEISDEEKYVVLTGDELLAKIVD